MNQPGYVALYETGQLSERARSFENFLEECNLCPRRCGVDRLSGRIGACGVDARPKVAAVNLHPWEEPPISGKVGSGTIFFSGCTLRCVFCQNYPISQLGVGRTTSVEELAEDMLNLQKRGAANINLVTPTHQVTAFVQALEKAAGGGLHIPIVYNSSGYENLDTLALLDGIVDIYLPDIKHDDPQAAQFCSGRADYVFHNRRALVEMWRQVGPIAMNGDGVAYRGMMVRHLVLPGGLSGTRECMGFLRRELGPHVWVSLMNQYFPAHKAIGIPPLDRKASGEEYGKAFDTLVEFGLDNGFVQTDSEDSDFL